MRLSFVVPMFVLAAAASTGCSVHAQVGSGTPGGEHPAYLRALSDLREARAEIEGRGGNANAQSDEQNAVAAIDRAMNDIRQASIDDGKNVNDHPPVDANLPPQGRLHRGVTALEKAKQDVNQGEQNGAARTLRERAIGDIDTAIAATNHAIAQF